MLDLWYKNAVIYTLDVAKYQDSNGDGIGDFRGLMRRLNYIDDLDVNCLWLMPFFPTPNRDDGYDVCDYYNVDPRLGTLGDFVEFMHQVGEHGLRVIADLVVNHTSDQHPWFQSARSDKNSPYRDYYVWSEEKPKNINEGVVFPGKQERTWTYDEQAEAWYFHRFHHFQPDLNMANPAVRNEICRIMGFWLQLGISGFRVDAAPFIIDQPDVEHAFREFREFLSWRRGDAILLAEANVPRDQLLTYFGDGNKMQMLFNFLGNQSLFLALAREDATPLAETLRKLPQPPRTGQWANFLRLHDELDLGRLSDEERQEVFDQFSPEEHMQIFERGSRRRLPPMLDGDRRRIELASSLMLSLPGTPVVRYGEEIGMGDDLSLEGRDSVRTPMQWNDSPNAGFSSAPADQLVHPVIDEGEYSYRKINVAAQRRDPDSFLRCMQRLLSVRRECPEIGAGEYTVLQTNDDAVIALHFQTGTGAVVTVHNLSDRPASVQLPIPNSSDEELSELLGVVRHQTVVAGDELQLEPYGYYWYRVSGNGWKIV